MNIPPIRNEPVPPPPKASTASVKPESKPPSQDVLQTERREKLMDSLTNQPALRPEVVERGRQLATNPNYPSDAMIGSLAQLFVKDANRK